jgi:3-hydroxy-3-methylglutaryl CoA synthase
MVREVVKNIVARRVKLHHKIDLIVFCGVYKSEYLSEPSVASMILRASDLTKEERAAHFSDHLFAFDIKNGALSTQTALETAAQILEARHLNNALVVCAEVQHPLHALSDPLALLPGAAAFLLSATPVSGALARLCRSQTLLFPDFQEDHTVCATWKGGNTVLKAHLGSRLNRHYMQGIEQAIDRFFANTGTQWSDYTYAVLPHYALQKGEKQHPLRLPEKAAPILVYTEEGAYTHGIAAAIEILSRHARLGECALVVQIASGLQVSVAEWKF